MRILINKTQKTLLSKIISTVMVFVLSISSTMWMFTYDIQVKEDVLDTTEIPSAETQTDKGKENTKDEKVEIEVEQDVIEEQSSEQNQEIIDNVPNITEQPEVEYLGNYTSYQVPSNSGFKSYMPYTVFSTSSRQYRLQKIATTGQYGIRTINGRFCIAVGTHFLANSSIGQYMDVVLENGFVIECVLADIKSDAHTDANHIITVHNGCVTEFVVDKSVLHSMAKRMGNVSYVDDNWKPPVKEIRVYSTNALSE